jgi:chaperone BCS1
MTKVSRSLIAVSQWVSYYSEDDDLHDDTDVLDDMGIFNYEKWASKIPPRYEPQFGTDSFTFNGRTFVFTLREIENKGSWGGRDEKAYIRCWGRSTQPLKDLLCHIKSWTLSKETDLTSVYRPAPRNDNDQTSGWKLQCCRTSRPIGTVALDQKQKIDIIRDINEYLHPATSRWYAARGIPYRRGYLFHGT